MSFADGGVNQGLLDDLYARYRDDPSSVPERWRRFFDPARGNGADPAPPSTPPAAEATVVPAPPSPPAPGGAPIDAPSAAAVAPVEEAEVLRGAAARTVVNMEASLGVPTATSVRTVPAKLLEVNRQILNNHLGRTGRGKVSFTHLIAFAVVRAQRDFPGLNASYDEVDGQPTITRHAHVNLGLAVDVTRKDGTRTLLVPNIKTADQLDFAQFWSRYEDLIAKVRAGKLSPDDFTATTATITNPGMIGTVHSVPRLMAGQGFIVGD